MDFVCILFFSPEPITRSGAYVALALLIPLQRLSGFPNIRLFCKDASAKISPDSIYTAKEYFILAWKDLLNLDRGSCGLFFFKDFLCIVMNGECTEGQERIILAALCG